jgi:hypothetical protein
LTFSYNITNFIFLGSSTMKEQTLCGIPVHIDGWESVKVMDLKVYPNNARVHPEKQVELLAKSIKKQGWRWGIIVSRQTGYIVSGHGRRDAAIALGLESVPVVFQDFESEEQEKVFRLADNRISDLAELQELALKEELKSLQDTGVDIEATGYMLSEVLEKLAHLRERDVNKIREMELLPFEKHDYVMFLFDDDQDFSMVCEALEISPVQLRYSPKCVKVGLGRVLKGEKLMELLQNNG